MKNITVFFIVILLIMNASCEKSINSDKINIEKLDFYTALKNINSIADFIYLEKSTLLSLSMHYTYDVSLLKYGDINLESNYIKNNKPNSIDDVYDKSESFCRIEVYSSDPKYADVIALHINDSDISEKFISKFNLETRDSNITNWTDVKENKEYILGYTNWNIDNKKMCNISLYIVNIDSPIRRELTSEIIKLLSTL